jgi:hypothetical protein
MLFRYSMTKRIQGGIVYETLHKIVLHFLRNIETGSNYFSTFRKQSTLDFSLVSSSGRVHMFSETLGLSTQKMSPQLRDCILAYDTFITMFTVQFFCRFLVLLFMPY